MCAAVSKWNLAQRPKLHNSEQDPEFKTVGKQMRSRSGTSAQADPCSESSIKTLTLG